jgi:hypothetical protein
MTLVFHENLTHRSTKDSFPERFLIRLCGRIFALLGGLQQRVIAATSEPPER